MTELQSGFKINCMRSDREGEFKSSKFVLFCENEGIQRQFTLAYTPQQNGVVERKSRTVIEMAKSMLHEKKMPYFLWAEAVHTSVYILNRCPTKALNNITPFKAYSGRKPRIAHLKIFGSLCYVHVPVECRHKLEPKSFKGVFVGYATCENGYRVFDPLSKKLFLSRDIVFDEEAAWNWEENLESISPNAGSFIYGDISTGSSDIMVLSPTSSTLSPPRRVLSIEDSEVQSKSPISSESASMSNLSERHNQAFDHTPLKWRNLNEVLAQCNLCIMDPEKYEDAKQDESWLKAMEDELFMIE
ncbi:unnamed protein product [Prunus armeniaca]